MIVDDEDYEDYEEQAQNRFGTDFVLNQRRRRKRTEDAKLESVASPKQAQVLIGL